MAVMQVHELIYTSAAELLEGAVGNLGVVARSRGFPRELEGELSSLHAYTLLPDLSIDAFDSHPHRIVVARRGGTRQFYCVSRVVFAGADHTGRTTPLAHHLVFDNAALSNDRIDACDVLQAAKTILLSNWIEHPHWIDPPRQISFAEKLGFSGTSHSDCIGLAVDPRFKDILPELAESLIQFPLRQRPILLCVEASQAKCAMDWIMELLRLLPRSCRADVGFASHVVSTSDYTRDSGCLITYPGTSFMAQCQRRADPRAPLIIDMTKNAFVSVAKGGDFAALIRECGSPPDLDELGALHREWDAMGMQPTELQLFRKAMAFCNAISSAASGRQLANLGSQIPAADPHGVIGKRIAEQALAVVRDRVPQLSEPERFETLAQISQDARWPTQSTLAAVDALLDRPNAALTRLLRDLRPGTQLETNFRAAISQRLRDRPQMLNESVSAAIDQKSEPQRLLAALILATAQPDAATTLGLVPRIAAASRDVRGDLTPALLQQLRCSLRSAAQLLELSHHPLLNGDLRATMRAEMIRPVIRGSLATLHNDDEWAAVANELIRLANEDGEAASEIRAIAPNHKRRISSEVAKGWLLLASDNQKAEVMAALNELRLPCQLDLDDVSIRAPDSLNGPIGASPGRREKNTYRAVAPQHARVGPILSAAFLAVAASILGIGAFAIEHFAPGRISHPRILMMLSLVSCGWLFTEVSCRLIVRTPSAFGRVAFIRWVLLAVLFSVVSYQIYISYKDINRWRRDRQPAPTTSASSQAVSGRRGG